MVKASGLRGRGGAGFPTGLKWTFLPQDHPGPIYFCLNADESEPGTFNNRILMEDDPHQVIEGMIISCFATQATTAYFYMRCEYPLAWKRICSRRSTSATPRLSRQEHPRQRLLARHLSASRGRGLHLRRRDRPDRKPRRQAGLAAHQAAVSRRRRGVPQADGREQRRDGRLRHADLRPRRRLVQIDRRAARSRTTRATPAATGRSSIACRGHVNKPGCYEAPLGITCHGADRRIRRRRLERPQGQSGDPRRHQHGPAQGRANSTARSISTARASSAAWAWAPRRSW